MVIEALPECSVQDRRRRRTSTPARARPPIVGPPTAFDQPLSELAAFVLSRITMLPSQPANPRRCCPRPRFLCLLNRVRTAEVT